MDREDDSIGGAGGATFGVASRSSPPGLGSRRDEVDESAVPGLREIAMGGLLRLVLLTFLLRSEPIWVGG